MPGQKRDPHPVNFGWWTSSEWTTTKLGISINFYWLFAGNFLFDLNRIHFLGISRIESFPRWYFLIPARCGATRTGSRPRKILVFSLPLLYNSCKTYQRIPDVVAEPEEISVTEGASVHSSFGLTYGNKGHRRRGTCNESLINNKIPFN